METKEAKELLQKEIHKANMAIENILDAFYEKTGCVISKVDLYDHYDTSLSGINMVTCKVTVS